MTCNIIATGSDGNATIINDTILIDCGVTMKALRPFAKQLRLVLLTHTHSDHFKPPTVRALAKARPALRWACCPWMVDHLLAAGVNIRCIDVIKPGHAAEYHDLAAVMPEKVHHNVPNCCWHVFTGGETLIYATDCGDLDGIEAEDYDMYLIECNHSRAELEARIAEKEAAGQFAYELKAAENHLSREQAIDWLSRNMGPNSKWLPMHEHKEKGGGTDGGAPDVGKDDH